MRVGDALVGVVSLRQRCIMTTFDPDTAEQDTEVLLRIHRELDGSFALDCEVVQPGTCASAIASSGSVTLPMAAVDAMTIVNADASGHSRAACGRAPVTGSFRFATGTRVAYADPALASIVERFCSEVMRRTGIWCCRRARTRKLPAGVPSIRVELARDAELDELPAADGASPAAEGASDERHVLWIDADRIVVRGVEPVGAARGLTTLVQLLATATPEEDDGTIVLPAARIVDAPRFAWRSLSFDLGRRFFTVGDVKRVIDLIALYKLNVLHLYVTDDHDNTELAELRELIDYARTRFVTLVSETSPAPAPAAPADAAPVVVSPVDHAYFDVPDAEAWSDPRAGGWSEHRDRLDAHRRLWEQDELTYFISSAEVAWRAGAADPSSTVVEGGRQTMTSDGVATGADELKQKLAQQIDAARSKLEMLKKDVVSLHEDDMEHAAQEARRASRAHRAPEGLAAAGARRHRPLEGGEDCAHPRRDHVVAAAARAGEARAPRRARRGLRAAHGEPGGDGLRGG